MYHCFNISQWLARLPSGKGTAVLVELTLNPIHLVTLCWLSPHMVFNANWLCWTGQKLTLSTLLSKEYGIPWKKGSLRICQAKASRLSSTQILMQIQLKTPCTVSCRKTDVHRSGLNLTKRLDLKYLNGGSP